MTAVRSRNPLRRIGLAWSGLAPYLGASGRRMGVLGLLSFGSGVLEALVLVLVAQLAVAISAGSSAATLASGPLDGREVPVSTALVVGLVATLLMFGLQMWTGYLQARMSADSLTSARQLVLHDFLEASWSLQSREEAGRLQDLLNTHVTRMSNGAVFLSTGFTAAMNVLALLASAFLVNPLAAMVVLVAMVGLASVLRPITKKAKGQSRAHAASNLDFASAVAETTMVTQEIRTFGVTEEVDRRLVAVTQEVAKPYFRASFLRQAVKSVYQAVAIVVVLVALGVLAVMGSTQLASLGAVILILLRSINYGQQLQTMTHQISETIPYLDTVRDQRAVYEAARVTCGDQRLSSVDSLSFERVSYRYKEDDLALENVSFEIRPGEQIGIVGPSGSGKSTLVQLLLRLRGPVAGQYLVNGRPAEDFDLSSWFRRVAFVPQTPRLIEGTVADNIRFYRTDLSDEAILDGARKAHIDEEIRSWPGGYDARLEGLAKSISGGQAQRLCLARALATRPDLLVLDEPTSALDLKSESLIQQTLDELAGQTTLITVAHRLSTLKRCDRIMVFEKGRLVSFDSPERLATEDRFFQEALSLSTSRGDSRPSPAETSR